MLLKCNRNWSSPVAQKKQLEKVLADENKDWQDRFSKVPSGRNARLEPAERENVLSRCRHE